MISHLPTLATDMLLGVYSSLQPEDEKNYRDR
jgi:hypothetical protein